MNTFLAGVGNLQLFDGEDNLIVNAKTLTDSAFDINTTLEDIRAGVGAALYGRYSHSSTLELNATDAMFSMEYIALNIGSDITLGGDALTNETVVTTTGGAFTITGTPVAFGTTNTIIGWWSLPGDSNWTKFTFAGQGGTATGISADTTICVMYNHYDSGIKTLTVSNNIVPSVCRAVLTANLYTGETSGENTSTLVGQMIIEIPNFMLNGSQSFSMSMTGASQTNLSGSALVANDDTSCSSVGALAYIKEVILNAAWYDNGVIDIAVQGGELSAGDSIVVRAIYSNGTTYVIPYSDLTVTNDTGTVVVGSTGTITSVTTEGSIKVSVSSASGAPASVQALSAVFNATT